MTIDKRPTEPNAFDFEATQWTLVLRVQAGNEAEKMKALEDLVRRYWRPLWKFVSWSFSLSAADADDAVQGFLEVVLRRDILMRARQERGRFRTFLLTSIRNHCVKEWHRQQALKRGGGGGSDAATSPAELSQLTNTVPGGIEEAVDREWAKTTMKGALKILMSDYEKRGQKERAEILVRFAVHGEGASQKSMAAQLQLTESHVAVELHRFRRRLRDAFYQMVSETVSSAVEAEDEAKYLLGLLTWT
jgi:RNA polymerase sigma factor (sigma-70 family)